MKYYIGYFSDVPYDVRYYTEMRNTFTVMAESHSKACAMFIRDSYTNAYKEKGIATQVVILNASESVHNAL